MPTDRRHAAIMFTDIVGYTTLMGEDEEKAFEVLRKNREVHSKFIEQFHGTLIKEMGDGMLISFNLASDAVRCAIEIQKACKGQNIRLKIGIHEGEMVFEGNDVLGDGVNIASRLQNDTEAGYISVSRSVYQDIKNKSDIDAQFLAEKNFKNVPEPIGVYIIKYDGRPINSDEFKRLKNKYHQSKSLAKPWLVKISTIILVLAVALVFFLFYSGTSVPFRERDWIVISDFKNFTDESILDHSLNTAFVLSINQSRFVNVINRKRMIDVLKRMKRFEVESIDEDLGREIALREGANIYIVPSISRVGTQYVLTANIQETQNGDILKSEILYAKSQDAILKKMDQLTKRTRRNLGESRYQIYGQSRPLSKATTSSLEALKQYSLGIENHINLKFKEAINHYENAIRIDSNFTSAKASFGNLLFERFDREKGRKWLDKAILSIDNLTDREKYGILAFYAANVENDLNKGAEITKTRIALYPDDPVAHNNLGWYCQNQQLYKEAVNEYKTAISIDPYMMLSYGGINWTYMDYLGNFDSLLHWSNQMIKYGPENPWGYFYLGSYYIGIDQLNMAETAFIKASKIDPEFHRNLYRLSHTYRLQGKYEKAIEVINKIIEGHPEEISAHYDLGINYILKGNQEQAIAHFQKYRNISETWLKQDPDDPNSYIFNGIVLAHLGEKEQGWEIGKKALDMDPTNHFEISQLLAVLGRKTEAIEHLGIALENGYRNLVYIKSNPDLYSLYNEKGFEELTEKYFGL